VTAGLEPMRHPRRSTRGGRRSAARGVARSATEMDNLNSSYMILYRHDMAVRDRILALNKHAPAGVALEIAERVRARRLEANLAQEGLAARAGVSLGSLKRFERTGEISLERLIRIALALDASEGFEHLFAPKESRTLDEIIATPPARRRGRRR
jgi:hypothetical protein